MKIKNGFILPSSAYTVPISKIKEYHIIDKKPEVGDLVYGTISYIGAHLSLENKKGRIHSINDGSKAIFVYGNRYAPDHYEGFVPEDNQPIVDLLSRSGIIGKVSYKNSLIGDPTQVKILGYVCDQDKNIINTLNYSKITIKNKIKTKNRAKLILCIGTSMNSGKSTAAAACCWTLSNMGYNVRGSKITGTASLKDLLLMSDNGASIITDFTYFGHPSTYLLPEHELLNIFNIFDLKYANNSKNYWVVEIADGILQRETSMLLQNKDIISRIHKLIFCAGDALGVIGSLSILKSQFNLIPDAISGKCSTSPLSIRELQNYCDIPIFNSLEKNIKQISKIIL